MSDQASKKQKSKTLGRSRSFVSVTIGLWWLGGLFLGVAESHAMARWPVHFPDGGEESSEEIPRDTGSGESDEWVDDARYEEGWRQGKDAAESSALTLAQSSIKRKGCEALSDFESDLVGLARSMGVPERGDREGGLEVETAARDPWLRGYFRGYLDGLRFSDRSAREACSDAAHASGSFAGELYGAYLGRVAGVSLEWVREMNLESLYEGWSGGRRERFDECERALVDSLKKSDLEAYVPIWGRVIESACWAD